MKLDGGPIEGSPWVKASDWDPDWYLLSHVGYLRRISDKDAVGGALFPGGNDRKIRFGLKGRYRRELSEDFSVEVSPGLVLAGWNDRAGNLPGRRPSLPTPAASLSLNYGDLLIPTLEMGLDRTAELGSNLRWYGVLEVGSKPGVMLGITTVVVGGIVLALVASNMEGFMQ